MSHVCSLYGVLVRGEPSGYMRQYFDSFASCSSSSIMLYWTAKLRTGNSFVYIKSSHVVSYPCTEPMSLTLTWGSQRRAQLYGRIDRLENAGQHSWVFKIYLNDLKCFIFIETYSVAVLVPWWRCQLTRWHQLVSEYDGATLPGKYGNFVMRCQLMIMVIQYHACCRVKCWQWSNRRAMP